MNDQHRYNMQFDPWRPIPTAEEDFKFYYYNGHFDFEQPKFVPFLHDLYRYADIFYRSVRMFRIPVRIEGFSATKWLVLPNNQVYHWEVEAHVRTQRAESERFTLDDRHLFETIKLWMSERAMRTLRDSEDQFVVESYKCQLVVDGYKSGLALLNSIHIKMLALSRT